MEMAARKDVPHTVLVHAIRKMESAVVAHLNSTGITVILPVQTTVMVHVNGIVETVMDAQAIFTVISVMRHVR